ncbi:uncharacterized protein ACNS7B_018922 [Menidia menidia]
MWRTAALLLGLVLPRLLGGGVTASVTASGTASVTAGDTAGGGSVTVACRLGHAATLPCAYHYEDARAEPRLSVQWRGPRGRLLCHLIKHAAFRNCSAGYAISYRPASIALRVLRVAPRDLGTHVCSVSKRHEFSDYSIRLERATESVTSAPTGGVTQSGLGWSLVLLPAAARWAVCW